jgi:hypothetical protein
LRDSSSTTTGRRGNPMGSARRRHQRFQSHRRLAARVMPPATYIYCKPITARPAVVLPVYLTNSDQMVSPRPIARPGRFLALASRQTVRPAVRAATSTTSATNG